MARLLDTYASTDVGRKRGHNEDFFYASDELGVYVVADGMGGHAAGEVASHKAVSAISAFVRNVKEDEGLTWPFGLDRNLSDEENLIVTAIKIANNEISAMAEERLEYHGMGTTVACLIFPESEMETEAIVAHVGDSRAYRMREGILEQLTDDHSWVNEQIARNIITEEEARNHRWRNVITRALGNRQSVDVDLTRCQILPGDMYMLCSDGLSSMVTNDDIGRSMRELANKSAKEITRTLINNANDAGGHDNITVLVVKVLDDKGEFAWEPHQAWMREETAPPGSLQVQDIAPSSRPDEAQPSGASEPGKGDI